MRFLLDESAEFRLAGFLKQQGYDVTAIAHDYPYALPDVDVLSIAHAERRILITNDRDFGDLIFRHNLPHAGVILFRIGSGNLAANESWLERVPSDHAGALADRAFLVVTSRGVRVRRAGR